MAELLGAFALLLVVQWWIVRGLLRPLGALEWGYLALVVGAGTLVGLLPAWRAYRTSLTDGLAPKV